uniref:AlNc14C325G10623 protein n=1 Tax=Albugo laibachii Nc14 TaxID=890382 RepID=F0WWL1_9STRA|nr:AlNc14C325G10623 [Albugo laibachii Nc14]|eukprot:CCA25835.1 AlNc14C325G10623 [Albugo laibachii Nc14]
MHFPFFYKGQQVLSPNGSDDGDTVARDQIPSQSASPRRVHIDVAEECEENGANVAAGNGDGCSVRVGVMGVMDNINSVREMVQLMCGLMGRLDRVEESQS